MLKGRHILLIVLLSQVGSVVVDLYRHRSEGLFYFSNLDLQNLSLLGFYGLLYAAIVLIFYGLFKWMGRFL